MVRLFYGEVDVSYYQFYLETPEVIPGDDVERRFAGQANGLCGAGEPGMLQFTTGLHTGLVPVTVDLLDTAPEAVEPGWEEVVEVSLTTTTPSVLLYDWDHQHPVELPLGHGTFRVRYHAHNMQTGSDADTRQTGEPVLDRYLLQIWPAPPASDPSDAVLRQTSDLAAYWHDTARNTPATTTRQSGAAGEDERIVAFRAMIEGVTTSSPANQRAAAYWLARHAAAHTDPPVQAWLEPALAALERGQALPDPFTDLVRALELAPPPEQTEETGDTDPDGAPVTPDAESEHRLQATKAALLTLHDAADPDPTRAFMGALARTQNRVHPCRRLSERELHATLHNRFAT